MTKRLRITMAAARKNKNYTQTEAAKMLSVSKTTILNWENGRTAPSIAQFHKMCELYDVTPEDIILPKK